MDFARDSKQIEASLLSRGFLRFFLGLRRDVPMRGRGLRPYGGDGTGSGLSEEPVLGV